MRKQAWLDTCSSGDLRDCLASGFAIHYPTVSAGDIVYIWAATSAREQVMNSGPVHGVKAHGLCFLDSRAVVNLKAGIADLAQQGLRQNPRFHELVNILESPVGKSALASVCVIRWRKQGRKAPARASAPALGRQKHT